MLIFKTAVIFDHLIPAYLLDALMYLKGGNHFIVKTYGKIHSAWSSVKFFITKDFHFSNNNVVMLYNKLTETDKKVTTFYQAKF